MLCRHAHTITVMNVSTGSLLSSRHIRPVPKFLAWTAPGLIFTGSVLFSFFFSFSLIPLSLNYYESIHFTRSNLNFTQFLWEVPIGNQFWTPGVLDGIDITNNSQRDCLIVPVVQSLLDGFWLLLLNLCHCLARKELWFNILFVSKSVFAVKSQHAVCIPLGYYPRQKREKKGKSQILRGYQQAREHRNGSPRAICSHFPLIYLAQLGQITLM